MSQPAQIKFALDFPQGYILSLASGGLYFQPRGADEAFMIWGERKELFGKNAVTVALNRENGTGGYSVVYEFGDAGALADARLVRGQETVRGQLAAPQAVENLQAAIDAGVTKLYSTNDTRPDTIFNIARFDDGRLLVQMMNRNELYIGTAGNFTKVDAELYVQGGNSMYYRMKDGTQIALPWGMGGPRMGEEPKFGDETLMYVNVKHGTSPADIGLDVFKGIRHLDPFSEGLPQPAGPKAAPKPPGA